MKREAARVATNGRMQRGKKFGCRTSSLSSPPLLVAASFPVPAREIPAVIPPFFGLLGLQIIESVSRHFLKLANDSAWRWNFDVLSASGRSRELA